MKAVRFHEYGGAGVLRFEDAPEPAVGADDVLIRVRAVGLNHVDIDMRNGTSRLPLTLPSTQTTFATAWHCLVTRAKLRPGETVLISAAGSGVGSSGIQVAKRAGARVITSAGSDEKLERARALGADAVVNYTREDLTEVVREVTDGRGVDVVLEHVGGEVFTSSLDALATGGRVVVCGGHAGEVVPVDLILLFRNEWSVIGCARATEAELREVIELVGRGELDPVVSHRLGLEEAARGHEILEGREQFGKVLLHA